MNKHLLIASGAAIALLVATPAFADSDRFDRGEKFGLNIGGISRFLDKDRKDTDRRSDDTVRAHATSTTAISGTVTAMNGTVLTLAGENAATYTVQAANAVITSGNDAFQLSDIRVGDTLKVKGSVSGTIFVATKITDKSIHKRETLTRLENLRAGIVTSVTDSAFTITRFGTGTSATVATNASTTIRVNGKASTTAAITPGSAVVVVGATTTASGDTVVGSVVHVITKSFGWLKHFLFR